MFTFILNNKFTIFCPIINKLIVSTCAAIILFGCVEDYPPSDHSRSTAIYAAFMNKKFVIAEITNDNGINLLDSVYSCAKDDTFSVQRIAPGAAVISLKIKRGNDWCNQSDETLEKEEWTVTQNSESASFDYYLPPKYQETRFSTRPGSKNFYEPDDLGNFTLTIGDSDVRTYYVFKKIE